MRPKINEIGGYRLIREIGRGGAAIRRSTFDARRRAGGRVSQQVLHLVRIRTEPILQLVAELIHIIQRGDTGDVPVHVQPQLGIADVILWQ